MASPGGGGSQPVVFEAIDNVSEGVKKIGESLSGFYELGEGNARNLTARFAEMAKAISMVTLALRGTGGLTGALAGTTIAGGMAAAAMLGLAEATVGFAEKQVQIGRMSRQMGLDESYVRSWLAFGDALKMPGAAQALEHVTSLLTEVQRADPGALRTLREAFGGGSEAIIQAVIGNPGDRTKPMQEIERQLLDLQPQMRGGAAGLVYGNQDPKLVDLLIGARREQPRFERGAEFQEQAKRIEELSLKIELRKQEFAEKFYVTTAPAVLDVLERILILLSQPAGETLKLLVAVALGGPVAGGLALERATRPPEQPKEKGATTDAGKAAEEFKKRSEEATNKAASEAFTKGQPPAAKGGIWEWIKKNLSFMSSAGAAEMPGGAFGGGPPGATAGGGAAGAGAGGGGGAQGGGGGAAGGGGQTMGELFTRSPGAAGTPQTWSSLEGASGGLGGLGGGTSGGVNSGSGRQIGGGGHDTSGPATGVPTDTPGQAKSPGGPLKVDANGNVDPQSVFNATVARIKGGPLDGLVPKDGAQFGILKGTPEEWARLMVALGMQETDLNARVGPRGGMLQFREDDLRRYGVKGAVGDPNAQLEAGIRVFEKFIPQDGEIGGGKTGRSARGAGRYFEPIQRPHQLSTRWGPAQRAVDAATGATARQQSATGGAGQVFPVSGTVTGVLDDPRGGGRRHAGMDIAAEEGAPIAATVGGKVIRAQEQHGYGLTVDIQRADGTIDRYAHMSAIGVKLGQDIRAGQGIGNVGHTTGPGGARVGSHLHYEHRRHSDFGRAGVLDPEQDLGIHRRQTMQRGQPVRSQELEKQQAKTQGNGDVKGNADITVTVRPSEGKGLELSKKFPADIGVVESGQYPKRQMEFQ